MALLDNLSKQVNAVNPQARELNGFMREMKGSFVRESITTNNNSSPKIVYDEDLDERDIAYLNSVTESDTDDDNEEFGFEEDADTDSLNDLSEEDDDVSSYDILADAEASEEESLFPESDDDVSEE